MLVCSIGGASIEHPCAESPEIVGPCFELRGRLSFWNGAPSARIWRVGSNRMLGVHNDVLPAELASKGFDTEMWGTFAVCPLTQQVHGHMQIVCIESWRDLTLRQRRDDSGWRSR